MVDLGGNRGEFARQTQHRWSVRCLSVEANPSLCQNWSAGNQVINAAVSATSGFVEFYVCENSESSSLFDRGSAQARVQVPAMTLEQVVDKTGAAEISLVKIDIEGAEIESLLTANEDALRRIQQITVEFHDFALPEISPDDIARVKQRLHALGFWSVSFSRRNTDVLFINRNAGLVTWLEMMWIRYVVRNLRGAMRVGRRFIGQ